MRCITSFEILPMLVPFSKNENDTRFLKFRSYMYTSRVEEPISGNFDKDNDKERKCSMNHMVLCADIDRKTIVVCAHNF